MTAKGHIIDDQALGQRQQMPEALRALLAEFPRDAWQAHPHFTGLVQFWLDRHLMFRDLLKVLQSDTEAVLDARLDPQQHKARLARFGGMLVNQLHGHHQIEDHHYFPVLIGLEPRLQRGFDILDADHHALDGVLARFTDRANTPITTRSTACWRALPTAPMRCYNAPTKRVRFTVSCWISTGCSTGIWPTKRT